MIQQRDGGNVDLEGDIFFGATSFKFWSEMSHVSRSNNLG